MTPELAARASSPLAPAQAGAPLVAAQPTWVPGQARDGEAPMPHRSFRVTAAPSPAILAAAPNRAAATDPSRPETKQED